MAISDWQAELRLKGFSEHSLSAYLSDVEDFLSSTELADKAVLSVDLDGLRAWLAGRMDRGMSVPSNLRAVSAVKSYMTWLQDKYGTRNEAIWHLQLPKRPKLLPKPLSEAQAVQALDSFDLLSGDEWVVCRDRLLLGLLYGTGLRIAEALSITRRQLDGAATIMLRGKGNKDRIVPILPLLQTLLQDYLAHLPHMVELDDALFVGVRGGPLQPAVFQRRIRDMRRACGLPEHATPHAMRHSFATHMLAHGADLREIQALLGHASLSSTQIYTDIEEQEMLASYVDAHPRA